MGVVNGDGLAVGDVVVVVCSHVESVETVVDGGKASEQVVKARGVGREREQGAGGI